MFSEMRQSATGALEKAKLAFQQQRSLSINQNDQEEQRHLPTAAAATSPATDDDRITNVINDTTTTSSMNAAWKDFRSSSTKALEKAKLALTRNQSSLSVTENDGDDDNSNTTNDNNCKNRPALTPSPSQGSIDRLEELSQYCPKLTIQQRLMGFVMSFCLGYLIAFFSFRFFIELIEGNPLPFALNYTFGHVLQLLASMFLCGPKRQFKNMFDEKRRQTSIIYLSCLVITLLFVFVPLPSNKLRLLLLILIMLIQFCASCWYTLSYIPYGRKVTLKIIKKIIGIEDSSENTSANQYIGLQLPSFGGTMA